MTRPTGGGAHGNRGPEQRQLWAFDLSGPARHGFRRRHSDCNLVRLSPPEKSIIRCRFTSPNPGDSPGIGPAFRQLLPQGQRHGI
jgi:hypothetical protein